MLFTIEIGNLPPETDLPTFRRLLSSRVSSFSVDQTHVVEFSDSLRSQKSFRMSFSSRVEVQAAINDLKSSNFEGYNLDVTEVIQVAQQATLDKLQAL